MIVTDNFTPFFGVIENVLDPEKLDRVQVRCYGFHSKNRSFIPTDYLVWFSSITSNSADMSGLGYSGSGYLNGTTVFGFFTDKELQSGIILGALKGKPTEKTFSNMGFSDPTGVYPLYVNESDVNRIARNENIDKTIVGYKLNNRVINVPDAKGGVWSEPETAYNTEYPNNKVFETASGHVVEYDDTPGSERISINHKSGSFDEFHPDGSKVEKTLGSKFNIFLGGNFIFVNGDINQVVTGNVKQNIMGEYYCKADSIVFDSDVKILGNSEATDHISSGVSGKDHTHNQPNDSRGDTQQPTDEPNGSGSGFSKTSSNTFTHQQDLFDPEIRKT